MSDQALRALRREVERLSFELGAANAQVPHLWAMVEGSRDGLALIDAGGAILECNRALERMLGSDRTVLTATPIDQWLVPEPGEPSVTASLSDELRSEHPHVARTPHGDAVEWLVNPAGHPAADGALWVVSARALTDATVHARALREARQQEASLSAALDKTSRGLAERAVLLQEIHHRVKNNLQIISSLLAMQADAVVTPDARMALANSAQRVRSMALIHQQLYVSDNLAHIDVVAYLQALIQGLQGAIGDACSVAVEADPLDLPLAKAVPFGLLVNELLTNAFKHGRSADGACRVTVALRVADGRVTLSVTDSGPGLPEDFAHRRRNSLGLSIADTLARQLGDQLQTSTDHGARFLFGFSVGQPAPGEL